MSALIDLKAAGAQLRDLSYVLCTQPNVKDHRAAALDRCEAEIALVAGSGASPCWAVIS